MGEVRSCELIRSWYDYLTLNPDSRPRSSQNSSYEDSSCLQSSLLAFLINPDESNESVMREQFQKMQNFSSCNSSINASDTNCLSLDLSTEDENDIVRCLLSSSSTPSSSWFHRNRGNEIVFEDGLQLAANLQSFRESIMKTRHKELQQQDTIDLTSSSEPHTRPTTASQPPPYMHVNVFKPPSMKLPENNSINSNVYHHARPRSTNAISNKRVYGDTQSNSSNNSIPNTSANKGIEDDNNIDVYEKVERRNPFKSGRDQFLEDGGSFPTPPPSNQQTSANVSNKLSQRVFNKPGSSSKGKNNQAKDLPPELAHLNPQIVEKIEGDILHKEHNKVKFADIAGLEFAKKNVQELIVWPICRPDIFTGLRALPKGLLLFGPPGTGKTLIGKAIAHESGATFFSISASSLTSKWIGEGEMAVRTLFAVAAYYQPSVVFMDEVDSLLTQRSSEENEASRRIKTEFLVQLDGAGTDQNARIVVIGATNRPDELDEAARRRFVKRIYVPLPDVAGRRQMIGNLLRGQSHTLNEEDIFMLIEKTNGYSGADIRSIGTEAAMGPCREIFKSAGGLGNIAVSDMPPIRRDHFEEALESVAPSVSTADLQRYVEWNGVYGSYRKME